MEGSSSNFTQNDNPESSSRRGSKRKQPEGTDTSTDTGTATNPIIIEDDNQPDSTTLIIPTRQEIIEQQIRSSYAYLISDTEEAVNNNNPVRARPASNNNGITIQEDSNNIIPLVDVPHVVECIQAIEILAPHRVPRLMLLTSLYRRGMISLQQARSTLIVLRTEAALQYSAEFNLPIRAIMNTWLTDEHIIERIRWHVNNVHSIRIPIRQLVSRGLNEEQIQRRMERHVYHVLNNVSAEEEVGRCCVCLDDFSYNDEIGKLDCGHQFHYECIKEWLKEKNSCPMCKQIALAAPM